MAVIEFDGQAPDSKKVIATVLLPISLKRLNRLVHLLVREHESSVRMYQEGQFMVLYVPDAPDGT